MTDLTAAQHRKLRADQHNLSVATLAASHLAGILVEAHLGAALVTTPDTPSSRWATGGIPGGGTISDPTGQAAVRDAPIDDRLHRLSRGVVDLVASINHLHQLATQLAANLEPDQKRAGWQGELDLDAENMGAGRCCACDRDVAGTRDDRLRPVGRGDLRACDACRKAWQRELDRNLDADYYAWCDDRRRRVERTDGREAV